MGRIATASVVGLGMIWIPVMAKISGGGLYQYLQSVQGYLAPPITAVFFLGLFWKRINATGAVWGLIGGFILGMIKLSIQVRYGAGKVAEPALLASIGDFNFLYATGILFAASALIRGRCSRRLLVTTRHFQAFLTLSHSRLLANGIKK